MKFLLGIEVIINVSALFNDVFIVHYPSIHYVNLHMVAKYNNKKKIENDNNKYLRKKLYVSSENGPFLLNLVISIIVYH